LCQSLKLSDIHIDLKYLEELDETGFILELAQETIEVPGKVD